MGDEISAGKSRKVTDGNLTSGGETEVVSWIEERYAIRNSGMCSSQSFLETTILRSSLMVLVNLSTIPSD